MRPILLALLALTACPDEVGESVSEVSTAVAWGREVAPCVDGEARTPDALIVQAWHGPLPLERMIRDEATGEIVIPCGDVESVEVRWIAP